MFNRRNKQPEQPVRQAQHTIEEQSYAFRRSRTLTGSVSPQISTATESRAQLKSPRLRAQELRAHRRKLSAGFVGVSLAIVGCLWLLDQYVVTPSVASREELATPIDQERYQAAISKYYGSHPFERFLFALDVEALEQSVRSQLPEVQSVRMSNDTGLVAAEATMTLRRPVAVWTSDEMRVYVDDTGATFTRNYYQTPEVTIEDQSGVSTSTDTRLVASSRLLTFAGQLVSGIDASGVGRVTKVVIPLGSLRQLDVSLAETPYRIKTHMDRDPVGQVFDVVSAVRFFTEKQIIPEYVDVRVEGKAFYR